MNFIPKAHLSKIDMLARLPVEVVLEEGPELLGGVDVGAGGDEVAAGEPLVEGGVVAAVELVDGQLPDRVRAAGAVVAVAVALVGHPRTNGERLSLSQ